MAPRRPSRIPGRRPYPPSSDSSCSTAPSPYENHNPYTSTPTSPFYPPSRPSNPLSPTPPHTTPAPREDLQKPPPTSSSTTPNPFGDDSIHSRGFTFPFFPPRTSRPGNKAVLDGSVKPREDLHKEVPRTKEFGSALEGGREGSTRLEGVGFPLREYFDTEMTQVGAYAEVAAPTHPEVKQLEKDPPASGPLITFPSSPQQRPPSSSSDLYTDDSKTPHTPHKQPSAEEEAEEAKWDDVHLSDDEWEKVHKSEGEDVEWEVVAPHRAINAPPVRDVSWKGRARGDGGGGERSVGDRWGWELVLGLEGRAGVEGFEWETLGKTLVSLSSRKEGRKEG